MALLMQRIALQINLAVQGLSPAHPECQANGVQPEPSAFLQLASSVPQQSLPGGLCNCSAKREPFLLLSLIFNLPPHCFLIFRLLMPLQGLSGRNHSLPPTHPLLICRCSTSVGTRLPPSPRVPADGPAAPTLTHMPPHAMAQVALLSLIALLQADFFCAPPCLPSCQPGFLGMWHR